MPLDWDQSTTVAGVNLVCTPARHFSGRTFARDTTLWSSWVARSADRGVFFAGDTGYTPEFAEIGDAHGPFDLAILPIGAYDEAWPDIHLNPEEAVQLFRDVRARMLMPVHWGTFDLAFHDYDEPMARLLAAAGGIDVVRSQLGERKVLSGR